jgi:hypothetical protein
MTTTETTREELTLHLHRLSTEGLQNLIERLGGAYWMSNSLIYARQQAEKMRREADELERKALDRLAVELLEEWTPDEIETAK